LATWASCLFNLGRADYNGAGGAALNTEWVLAYIRLQFVAEAAQGDKTIGHAGPILLLRER